MSSLFKYINSWWVTPETNHDGTSQTPETNHDGTSQTPEDSQNVNYFTSDIHLLTSLEKYPESIIKSKDPIKDIVHLISVDDLLNVKLKPVKNVIPSPARNMPVIDKFKLHMLNQAQLKEILSVKLRPISPRNTRKYEHRHPVLREMLQKVERV